MWGGKYMENICVCTCRLRFRFVDLFRWHTQQYLPWSFFARSAHWGPWWVNQSRIVLSSSNVHWPFRMPWTKSRKQITLNKLKNKISNNIKNSFGELPRKIRDETQLDGHGYAIVLCIASQFVRECGVRSKANLSDRQLRQFQQAFGPPTIKMEFVMTRFISLGKKDVVTRDGGKRWWTHFCWPWCSWLHLSGLSDPSELRDASWPTVRVESSVMSFCGGRVRFWGRGLVICEYSSA